MGRFYKTSKSEMLDFTLDLPEEMMIQSVHFNDQMVNQELAAYDAYMKANTGQGLGDVDTQKMNQITNNYQKKIDSGIDTVNKNPLDWRNYVSDIKKIGTDMYYDKTQGEWGKIQGNYDAYQQWSQNLDEYSKKNPDKFTPEDMQKLRAYKYKNWQGTNFDKYKGTGNVFQGINPAEYVDIGKMFDLAGKGFKANSNTIYSVNPNGQFIVKSKSGIEQVSAQRVYNAMINRAKSDPKVMAYLQQRYMVDKDLGYIQDKNYILKDKDGNLIKDFQGNDITNGDGLNNFINATLHNAALAPVNKYAYSKTESGITGMSANPFVLEEKKQKNRILLHKIKTGGTDKVGNSSVNLQIFSPKDFNAQGVQEEIDNQRNSIAINNQQIADKKLELGKYDEGSREYLMIEQQINELELQNKDHRIILNNMTNIGAMANNGTVKQLLNDGWKQKDIDYYVQNYDRMNQAEKNYKDLLKAQIPVNTGDGFNVQIQDPIKDPLNPKQVADYYDISILEANQKINDYQNYQTGKKVNKAYTKAQTKWYNTNQNENTFQQVGINIAPLKNDVNLNNGIFSYLTSGNGRMVNSNLLITGKDDAQSNSHIKKTGFWGRLQNSKTFDFNSYGKENFDKYATITNVRNVGGTDIVDIYIDDPNIRFTDDGNRRNTISVEFDKNTGFGDYVSSHLRDNYTPANQQVALAMNAVGGGYVSDVINVMNVYSKAIPQDFVTGTTNNYSPQIFQFGDITQKITPTMVNNSIMYNIESWYKGKPINYGEGDEAVIGHYNNSRDFGGGGLGDAAMDLINLQNLIQGVPPISEEEWEQVAENISISISESNSNKTIIK